MVVGTTVARHKPQLMFLLVHGTFGRDGDWMNEAKTDSLAAQLKLEFERDFEVHIDKLDWGLQGALRKRMPDNTVHSRLKGAALLAERLESLPTVSPTYRCYLVAHSHGGNVVLYALRDGNLQNKVTGIVCLSTPFLHYAQVDFHRDLPILSLGLLFVVACAQGNPFLWAYFVVYAAVVAKLSRTKHFGEDDKSFVEIKAHVDQLLGPVIHPLVPGDAAFFHNRRSGGAESYKRLVHAALHWCDKFLVVVSDSAAVNEWVVAEVEWAISHARPMLAVCFDGRRFAELLERSNCASAQSAVPEFEFGANLARGQREVSAVLKTLLAKYPLSCRDLT